MNIPSLDRSPKSGDYWAISQEVGLKLLAFVPPIDRYSSAWFEDKNRNLIIASYEILAQLYETKQALIASQKEANYEPRATIPMPRDFRLPTYSKDVVDHVSQLDADLVDLFNNLRACGDFDEGTLYKMAYALRKHQHVKRAQADSRLQGLTRHDPFVYVAYGLEGRYVSKYKIGFSATPFHRIREFADLYGTIATPVMMFQTPSPEKLERELHQAFYHCQIGLSEWFGLQPSEVIAIHKSRKAVFVDWAHIQGCK